MSISLDFFWKTHVLSDKGPPSLIFDFVANLELLAEKNKAETQSKFLEIEHNIKSGYTLNERGSFSKSEARVYDYEAETDASTHFLRIQKIN